MEELLEKYDAHKVNGEIYKIINKINNKCYIGQTRSHRLNREKYRPFGHLGRFKDHISESKNLFKKKKCTYLNNAIIKYGVDNFDCELIITCNINELDYYEIKYIAEYSSKYPTGYNLTDGGQKKGHIKGKKIKIDDTRDLDKIHKIIKEPRSEYTKLLISERLKELKNKPENIEKNILNAQKQHYLKKFDAFKDCKIDTTDIDQYIKVIKNHKENNEYIRITINKKRTNFVGKYDTIDDIKKRARIFILDLLEWQDNLDAGTPLEPLLPLDSRNVKEDLG
jgi:hypothetical protein